MYVLVHLLTYFYRQHPAVISQPGKVFVFVAHALAEESLTGQTANRVLGVTKALVSSAGVDPTPLLQQFSPDAQQKIKQIFS
jgi:hypothetical protein